MILNADKIKEIIDYVGDNQDKIKFNENMFEISEGNLIKYVKGTLKNQISPESYQVAVERLAPINVWNKIIKKLSKLYSNNPTRYTDNPADQEIVDYYVNKGLNRHMGNLNENYNSYKWSTVEIYEDPTSNEINFRSIPSHQFIAYSDDRVNPLRPTAIVKFMGQHFDKDNVSRDKFFIYTEDSFVSVLDNGDLVEEDMQENEGINPFGVIPFQYVSMSEYMLVPTPDFDTFKMTVLIPVLITDQNFGSLFLSLPIIYAVDAGLENLPVSPNMFVNLKSDGVDGKQAQIGVVRAEPDLQSQMDHVKNQLAMWLETRDIKAGTIGNLDGDNFSSGISKIISEMDTLENRKTQQEVFRRVEHSFWKRLAVIHNTLAKAGRLKFRKLFSDPESLEVNIDFGEEQIIESKADKIDRLVKELNAGLISKGRAMRQLNQNMTDEEVEQLLIEIEEEKPTLEMFDGTTEDDDQDQQEVQS